MVEELLDSVFSMMCSYGVYNEETLRLQVDFLEGWVSLKSCFDRGMGRIRETTGKEKSAVGSPYQKTAAGRDWGPYGDL
jgi:hypothetical protein